MTGYSENANRTANHPSFGAVMSKMRGSNSANDIPPFVSLRGMTRGTEPAFLGIAHRPFTPSSAGQNSLKLAQGMDMSRLDDRKALLSSFDEIRRDIVRETPDANITDG